jgi:uncharacterized membrane protein YhaH (DUF805 family)
VNNPYTATASDLTQVASTDDTYLPSLWSVNGRIGRVRYLAYANAMSFIVFGIIAVGAVLMAASPMLGMAVIGLTYLAMIPASLIIGRRRLHDLGRSGWFLLLFLVPLVNIGVGLWMLFGAGNEGSNEYGPAPAANTTGVLVLAWGALVLSALIGIGAAVAIPAYQAYVLKSRAAQVEQDAAQQAAQEQEQLPAEDQAPQAAAPDQTQEQDQAEGQPQDQSQQQQAPQQQ